MERAQDTAALGSTSAAVWTRQAALAVLTPGQVATHLRTGAWQSPWPGVLADGGFVLDAVQRAWAAVLASGGEGQPGDGTRPRLRAVACGRTAARVWGLPLIDDDDPSTGASEHLLDDVAVFSHHRPLRVTDEHGRLRELRRHRLRLRPGDVVHRGGLHATSALRTVLDCAGLLTVEAAVSLVDHALHVRLTSLDELTAAVSAYGGSPGARRRREVLGLCDERAESPGETLTRLLLRPALPGLRPQVRLRDDRGVVLARFDLADEDLRLAVEHDGRAGHEGRAADDHRRDAVARSRGWHTERVTWFDVRRRQEQTLRRVVGAAERLRDGRAA